ncbi:unnamed protein product [Linum trigynum]|uniref:Uncharacterized protein n=1 Tax=Linum trigynum TaxID=586398 RepID=A0AAV2D2S2_9ROSI
MQTLDQRRQSTLPRPPARIMAGSDKRPSSGGLPELPCLFYCFFFLLLGCLVSDRTVTKLVFKQTQPATGHGDTVTVRVIAG